MGRDRPTEPPRAVPDAQRGKRVKDLTPRQLREREEIKRLGRMHGPGFFGAVARVLGPDMPNVRFVRMGYAAGIVDELNDFYARRPRPWRPANRSSCGPTHKERLKARRRNEWALNTYGKTWTELLAEAREHIRTERETLGDPIKRTGIYA